LSLPGGFLLVDDFLEASGGIPRLLCCSQGKPEQSEDLAGHRLGWSKEVSLGDLNTHNAHKTSRPDSLSWRETVFRGDVSVSYGLNLT